MKKLILNESKFKNNGVIYNKFPNKSLKNLLNINVSNNKV